MFTAATNEKFSGKNFEYGPDVLDTFISESCTFKKVTNHKISVIKMYDINLIIIRLRFKHSELWKINDTLSLMKIVVFYFIVNFVRAF